MNYKKTTKRVITRRGVLWLGQTCNLHCHFCYFLDRIKTKNHPEHPFMSLEKAKTICKTLVDVYENNAIDIQGGEPTIYKDIYELVSYCRKIGLLPTLITNGLVLSKHDLCLKLKESGVRDLLLSVHGLGDVFDEIVGVKGAHEKQMAAIDNITDVGIPFRINCVLSKNALPQLTDIAELAIAKGARAINFIAFNPFEDQRKEGMRSDTNVPRYADVSVPLTKALDLLDDAGVEANVRYFPFCMLPDRHWKSNYNFQQLTYDLHEWDFASWSWTGMREQRMRDGGVAPRPTLEEATYAPVKYPGALQVVAERVHSALTPYPKLLSLAEKTNRKISAVLRGQQEGSIPEPGPNEQLYRDNARLRATEHCGYIYSAACEGCSLKPICDGFHGDYASMFTADEAKTICLEKTVDDPKHFISDQLKVVEEEDYDWAG